MRATTSTRNDSTARPELALGGQLAQDQSPLPHGAEEDDCDCDECDCPTCPPGCC